MFKIPVKTSVIRTHQLQAHIGISASVEAVFMAVTDWNRQSEWMVGTRVRSLHGEGRQSGAVIEAFSGLGSFGLLDTMTITAWEPPHRCEVLHIGKIIQGLGEFIVESRGDQQSLFIWREDLTLPFGRIGSWAFVFVRPIFLAGLRYSLRRLSASVERAEKS